MIRVDTGSQVLFPVVVRLPNGKRGAYRRHEIGGWRPSPLRLLPGPVRRIIRGRA